MGKSEVELAVPLLDEEVGKNYLRLRPGHITELVGDIGSGLTRLGLGMLADPSKTGPVVVVDTRGWISPEAAWEMGVEAESLVVVRCHERPLWVKVTAALLEGVPAIFAEVPAGVRDNDLRRLAALARARKALVAFRPMGKRLPAGVSYLRLRSLGVTWEGADRGHGRLKGRRLLIEASGKGTGGVTRRIEADDGGRVVGIEADDGGRVVGIEADDGGRGRRQFGGDGYEDENALRLVSNVVIGETGRATG